MFNTLKGYHDSFGWGGIPSSMWEDIIITLGMFSPLEFSIQNKWLYQ